MTHDAETIERVAKAIKNADASFFSWDQTTPVEREIYRNTARAALSALPPQEVSVQEAAKALLANCPNPIFDTLKPKLMGEFSQRYPFYNEEGEEEWADINISWTVTKDIIASALRALSENPHE